MEGRCSLKEHVRPLYWLTSSSSSSPTRRQVTDGYGPKNLEPYRAVQCRDGPMVLGPANEPDFGTLPVE